MRRIECDDSKSDSIAENITGEYRLKDGRPDLFYYGRQMPNGRLFVPYTDCVEMYEPGEYELYKPGEYELTHRYPRTKDEEDRNNA